MPGKISRLSHVMNGFAGLKMPKNQKQEIIELKGFARNLWKENAGLVVGLVVLIADVIENASAD